MAFQWNDDPRGRIMAENWNEIRNRIRTLENSINIPNYPTSIVSKGQQITPNVIQEYKKALDEVKAKNYCRGHNGSHHTSNRNFPHYDCHYTDDYTYDRSSPHYNSSHKGTNNDTYNLTHDYSDKYTPDQSVYMATYYNSSHRHSNNSSTDWSSDYETYNSGGYSGGCTSSHYGSDNDGHY